MQNEGRFPLKVVALSMNVKVGPMAATYRPVGDTCPTSCALLGNGCYAQKGNVNIHQNRAANNYHELDIAYGKGATMIRHHVSGDFYKDNTFDAEYFEFVIAWHRANPRMHGYAYTHRIADVIAAGYTADTLPSNFVLMASLNDGEEQDSALLDSIRAAGFRYTRVVTGTKEALAGRRNGEAVCPEQLSQRTNQKITCTTCKLCTHGKTNVVFIRH